MSTMRTYRCRCGQPLGGFAAGLPGLGLVIPQEQIHKQVDAAMARHRARCPGAPGRHELVA